MERSASPSPRIVRMALRICGGNRVLKLNSSSLRANLGPPNESPADFAGTPLYEVGEAFAVGGSATLLRS
ncbi:hypothetical protein [Fuerstiella marisgermanici]|uniref:hypothetical protein n=1 Tax=Fuerstiella marisgermanici TaxID=1891926 RepID=UPI0011AB6972|nr:hypothetical protein [Fuerstiella marisgermanici]